MKTLGREQAAEWACGVGFRVTEVKKSIHFPNEDPALCLMLPLPQKPYQAAYLANDLLPYSESQELSPCLLWMTDFGFWSEVSERVAHSLVGCFRSSRGETAPLIETPAHLFGSSKACDAQALLTIAIVFGWDCYVIPENASYYAFTSNDGYLEVVSDSAETHASFKTRLDGWDARER